MSEKLLKLLPPRAPGRVSEVAGQIAMNYFVPFVLK
jgi:hypothetical protein